VDVLLRGRMWIGWVVYRSTTKEKWKRRKDNNEVVVDSSGNCGNLGRSGAVNDIDLIETSGINKFKLLFGFRVTTSTVLGFDPSWNFGRWRFVLSSIGEEFFVLRMGKSQRWKKPNEMRLVLSTNEVVRTGTEFAQKGRARGCHSHRSVLNYSALFLIRGVTEKVCKYCDGVN
jgi:hypothetical protein